jgi:hypothetical protein
VNAEYDASSSGPEESDPGRHTGVGSVLGQFGVHTGSPDRPATGTLADSADTPEPGTEESEHPLTGTLADPGAGETEPAPAGTSAEPAGAEESFSQSPDPSVPGTAAGAPEPPMSTLDGPLIGDTAGLRGNWQHVQAGFVDDPRVAVGDAADLVEHAAQVLVGALQQRQRSLREMWDSGTSTGGNEAADTERLRLVMQRYRTLFNEICPP